MLDKEKIIELGFDELNFVESSYVRNCVHKAINYNFKFTPFYKNVYSWDDLDVYVKILKVENTYTFDKGDSGDKVGNGDEVDMTSVFNLAVVACVEKKTMFIVDAFMFELELGMFRFEPDIRALNEGYKIIQELMDQSEPEA